MPVIPPGEIIRGAVKGAVKQIETELLEIKKRDTN